MISIKNECWDHETFQRLKEIHVSSVEECIKSKHFNKKQILEYIHELPGMDGAGMREFLLAGVEQMRQWVKHCPEKLQFVSFREIYTNYFSNGSGTFVSGDYNAYYYLKEMDIQVCPYCEDEYLSIVSSGSKLYRTSEIDHFFPKSRYPALAMCFYNLIPCGQNCNGLKKETVLGDNPYEPEIESHTVLYPDLPVGINMSSVSPEDCRIRFHARAGMVDNVRQLALEQRYELHSEEAYRLLKNAQQYCPQKIDEMVRMGIGTPEELIENFFGPIKPEEKRKTLRQKMLHDLTGY